MEYDEFEPKYVIFGDITNYNCDGMCAQEFCSKRYTKCIVIKMNGVPLHIAVCDEHAGEIEKRSWEESEE